MQANLLYEVYEFRLQRSLDPGVLPRHIGVILDGNRRWAKAFGSPASEGHRAGADKVLDFLQWADEVKTEVVTLWLLSTDNLSREPQEINELLEIIRQLVGHLVESGNYRVKIVGDMTQLSPEFVEDVELEAQKTSGLSDAMQVNIAVGYGGRQELVDAVRGVLKDAADEGRSIEDVASTLSVDDITEHLYTRGQPDPELIIRTSGEQRLSGFLLWQSAHSEYYFCETFWPDFRKVDFLRALRSFSQRERRLGK